MNSNFYSRQHALVIFGFIFLLILPFQVSAEKRVALVVGNASYRDAPLSNPVNDAVDIAAALESTGFEVNKYTNIDRKQMREAIRDFGEQLKHADVGLFYFAGHGIQIKGRNYLIPLKADVKSADEVQDEGIDANSVLRKMESAGNAVNIVILDACRNNPFARSFRSMESGLARMEGPVGSFIAYATAPGSVAADGTGRNGLYTENLLKNLRQPGLSIEQLFKRVRNGVKNATDGAQIPWESSSLLGEFVFLQGQQQKDKAKLAAIPEPPSVAMKYLQVIANVPNATVMVNSVNRGLINDQGVLNISNLTSDEAEVVVNAEGYAPKRAKIRLREGQWEQLQVNLEPSKFQEQNPQPILTGKRNSQTVEGNCLKEKKILLASKLNNASNGKNETRHNLPKLNSAIINALKYSGAEFIDSDEARENSSSGLSLRARFRRLVNEYLVDYLLRATVDIRSMPIKVVKTGMETVNAEVTLELIDLTDKRVLATSTGSFNKAGIDPKRVLMQQMKQIIPKMGSELMLQVCSTKQITQK